MLEHPRIQKPPMRLGIVVGIFFTVNPGGWDWSAIWARVADFARNRIAASASAVQEGDVIFGITTPTYGTHLIAVFNTWIPPNLRTWRNEELYPVILTADLGRRYRADRSLPIGFYINGIITVGDEWR